MFGIRGLDPFGLVHALLGIAALALGLMVFLLRKGTPFHRRVGIFYLLAMLLLNTTALMIYDLLGTFGPFHWAALVSLATMAAGYIPVLFRTPKGRWTTLHAKFMCWSYVGLVAAFVSEVVTRIPGLRSGFWILVTTLLVMAGGAALIHLRMPRAISALSVHRKAQPTHGK